MKQKTNLEPLVTQLGMNPIPFSGLLTVLNFSVQTPKFHDVANENYYQSLLNAKNNIGNKY